LVSTGHREVGAEGEAWAIGDLEVGNGTIRARVDGGELDRPRAVATECRVDVVEGGELPIDDDEV
jgi:hypothetical protein